MIHRHGLIYLTFVLLSLSTTSCKPNPTSKLKGQTNATLTFYGKAVDEHGQPLPGVTFDYRVEAFPQDWTFETRGRLNDVSSIHATSGEDGRFQFTVTACRLILL